MVWKAIRRKCIPANRVSSKDSIDERWRLAPAWIVFDRYARQPIQLKRASWVRRSLHKGNPKASLVEQKRVHTNWINDCYRCSCDTFELKDPLRLIHQQDQRDHPHSKTKTRGRFTKRETYWIHFKPQHWRREPTREVVETVASWWRSRLICIKQVRQRYGDQSECLEACCNQDQTAVQRW